MRHTLASLVLLSLVVGLALDGCTAGGAGGLGGNLDAVSVTVAIGVTTSTTGSVGAGGAGGSGGAGGGGGSGGAAVVACGDCDAGYLDGSTCVMPGIDPNLEASLLALGLPAASTGGRATFDPDSYSGDDTAKVKAAVAAAGAVGGAVVMSRVYEMHSVPAVPPGTMITGGGLRRMCPPETTTTGVDAGDDHCLAVDSEAGWYVGDLALVATSGAYSGTVGLVPISSLSAGKLCQTSTIGLTVPSGAWVVRVHDLLDVYPTYSDGVILDSVLLDGNNRCTAQQTHDWRYSSAAQFRGANTARNVLLYDSPSEGLVVCGATVEDSQGYDLQGSFLHKSCAATTEPLDIVRRNLVSGANLAGDAVMDHSEGLITLSAHAGTISAHDNVFLGGGEGVFGVASGEDDGIDGIHDCYAHFDQVISLYADANQASHDFSTATLVDVPIVFRWF